MEGRSIQFNNATFPTGDGLFYGTYDIDRKAILASFLTGIDYAKNGILIGFVVGWSVGRQWNNAELVDGGPLWNDSRLEGQDFVTGPRLGFTLGLNLGKPLSAGK